MLSHQSVWRPVYIALSLSAALSIITLCDESVNSCEPSHPVVFIVSIWFQSRRLLRTIAITEVDQRCVMISLGPATGESRPSGLP